MHQLFPFLLRAVCLFIGTTGICAGQSDDVNYSKKVLTDMFYCEGACVGDFNRDGHQDVVAGPYWYAGPDFSRTVKIHEPVAFDPHGYSENFLIYVADFNDDGLGVGDLDGDGKLDILESAGWWQQPESPTKSPGVWHEYKFAEAGAQILVMDVNGDGHQDVITAWNCHLYGLVWHEQVRSPEGKISFRMHEILSPNPDLTSEILRTSQMHALALADINQDGLLDIVTGKRFWAHGPTGDVQPDAPAVVYWYELQRDPQGSVRFVPHRIDDDSGVGTQVTAADLNGDHRPDIIVSKKKSTFLFLSSVDSTQKN